MLFGNIEGILSLQNIEQFKNNNDTVGYCLRAINGIIKKDLVYGIDLFLKLKMCVRTLARVLKTNQSKILLTTGIHQLGLLFCSKDEYILNAMNQLQIFYKAEFEAQVSQSPNRDEQIKKAQSQLEQNQHYFVHQVFLEILNSELVQVKKRMCITLNYMLTSNNGVIEYFVQSDCCQRLIELAYKEEDQETRVEAFLALCTMISNSSIQQQMQLVQKDILFPLYDVVKEGTPDIMKNALENILRLLIMGKHEQLNNEMCNNLNIVKQQLLQMNFDSMLNQEFYKFSHSTGISELIEEILGDYFEEVA